MREHFKALFFIGLLGFLAFSNGLSNPFMIDDHAFFEEKLQNIKYLPLHFLPDKNRALHIEGESADPLYRPLATVVPMLSYLAFRNNTTGHHTVNLILLCLAGWGIYLFLRYLGAGYLLALLSAVFYVIHPANGVTVNYITASCFSVQVMLMLGALYFVLDSRVRGNDKVRMTGACILYLFSTWCHETAMMLPFYAFIMCAILSDDAEIKTRLLKAWQRVWPLFALLAVMFVFRMFYASLDESIIKKISWYDHLTFAQYISTWTMLVSWYLSRLFWPKNIVLIMAHQPLHEGLGIWFAVLVLLLALAVYLLWYFRRDKIVLMGLSLFFMGFAPSLLACFFQPIHGMMIEPHWFLFPVIGFFILLAHSFVKLLESRPPIKAFGGDSRWAARAALALFIFISIFFSRWHNWVWGDEVRYCKFWLAQSPSFVAVNGYIAKAYEYRGENDLARAHYRYMIKRGYKDYISYTNMALIDLKESKWASARENLLKVIEMDPRASVAVNDLGVIYFKEANYPEALKYFLRARDLNRFTILPYLDISKTYLKLGDKKKAIEALQQALDIVPGQEQSMVDLIQIYIEQKDKENVVKIARLMSAYSQNPYTLQNAGILLKYYGFPAEGQKASNKAQWILRHSERSEESNN